MEFPSLLFVNTQARGIMHDTLLNYKGLHRCETQKPVPRGEDIPPFFGGSGGQKERPRLLRVYGWLIQDFRYPRSAKARQSRERTVEAYDRGVGAPRDKISQLRRAGACDKTIRWRSDGNATRVRRIREAASALQKFSLL